MNFHSASALYAGSTEPALEQCYDRLAASGIRELDDWTKENLANFRPRHLLLARALQSHLSGPRDSIMDIGCHNGFFLRLISDAGLIFKRFLAVDYFELPPERSFIAGLPGVEFLKRNFNEDGFLEDFPQRSVDCVVSTEVFEHLYHHPLGYLEQCLRVLRPGGLLLLSTPNPCTLANGLRLALGKPISWGGVAFARTPKIASKGQPIAVWDIHFREYAAAELREIINSLPATRILESGFIASAAAFNDTLARKLAKTMAFKLGLGYWRPLAATQYMVVQKV